MQKGFEKDIQLQMPVENKRPTQKVKFKTTGTTPFLVPSSEEVPTGISGLKMGKKGLGLLKNDEADLNLISPKQGPGLFKTDEDDLNLISRKQGLEVVKHDETDSNPISQNQGINYALLVKDKKQKVQTELDVLPDPSQPMNVIFKKENKQPTTPAATAKINLKPSFKRRHDISNSQSPSQGFGTKTGTKIVMEMYKAFNEGVDQDNDIILDPMEIEAADLKKEHFFGACRSLIETGSFGAVYTWKTRRGETKLIKWLQHKNGVKVDPNEILTPLGLPGRGIIRILGLKCLKDQMWIIMDDAGKSLKWWLTNASHDAFRRWSHNTVSLENIACQLFKILQSLEKQGIVHRDIKPENLCVSFKNESWVFTLVDFGSAQAAKDKVALAAHTPEYLPPRLNLLIYLIRTNQPWELPQNLFRDEKCDLWAMALVIITIFNNGFHPIPLVNQYSSQAEEQVKERMEVMRMISSMEDGFFDKWLRMIRNPLQSVLQKCLLIHRGEACTAKEACRFLEEDGQGVFCKRQKMPMDTGKNAQSLIRPSALTRTLQDAGGKDDDSQQQFLKQSFANPTALRYTAKSPLVMGGDISQIPNFDVAATSPSGSKPDLPGLGIRTKPLVVGMAASPGTSATGPTYGGGAVIGIGGPTSRLTTSHRMIGGGMMRRPVVAAHTTTTTSGITSPIRVQYHHKIFPRDRDEGSCNANIPNILFDEDQGQVKVEPVVIVKGAVTQPMNDDDCVASFCNDAPGLKKSKTKVMDSSDDFGDQMDAVPNLDMMLPNDDNTDFGCQKQPRKFITGRRRTSSHKE